MNSAKSDEVTEGVRVVTHAQFLEEHSAPETNRYVFTYKILMRNESDRRVRLLARHWIIRDANGDEEEVRGPGVVGEFPDLLPGEEFTYRSFSQLPTSWGTMEGTYAFETEQGDPLTVRIGRFHLIPTEVLNRA
jgi:ApaG protein